jgi:hypothetical protein
MSKKIDFRLDEYNDVTFVVDIKSSEKTKSSPIIRFVCESGNIIYSFNGQYTGDREVEFEIPPLKGKIDEGLASGHLEVILEDKYFVPTKFGINFIAPTEVVAEMVTPKKGKKTLREETSSESVSAQVIAAPKSVKRRKGTLASKFKKA